MVFSSFLFLYFFLPLCIFFYFIVPKKLKNLSLLISSLFFYAWGTFEFFPIFLASSLIDFIIANIIFRSNAYINFKNFKISKNKFWLTTGIILNILLLGYYKYSNFFIHELNSFLVSIDFTKTSWNKVVLPIGISFITFQKISYLIDVYRKEVKPASNFFNYLLYIVLFPQLIAGPIVKYKDIAKQINDRKIVLNNILNGAVRFCVGLSKKVLLADTLGNVVNNVDRLSEASITTGYAWLGVICYGLQMYFDFSGYSDMAIGLGKIFGFDFLENFNKPFASQTFTEFWRRWHISLQRFMKDYLYIPLGGNRVSKLRSYINLWIVFLVSGFWHGANWTYIFWGAYHGLFLTIDKLGWYKKSENLGKTFLGKMFNTFLTLFFMQISWVIFKSKSMHEVFKYLGYMFNVSKYSVPQIYPLQGRIIHSEAKFILLISIIIIIYHILFTENERIINRLKKLSIINNPIIKFTYCLLTLFICTAILSASKFSPFIYFQF